MNRYKKEAIFLIEQLYDLYYKDEKSLIYELFSHNFKEKVSINSFVQSRKYRDLDLGVLRDIVNVIVKDGHMEILTIIYIGGCELERTYKCTVEEGRCKLIFDRHFLPD